MKSIRTKDSATSQTAANGNIRFGNERWTDEFKNVGKSLKLVQRKLKNP